LVSKLFETLSKTHDRERFDCGVPELNFFLRHNARQQQKTGVSRTFVLVDRDAGAPKRISGFFTLVAAQLDSALLDEAQSKRLPNNAPCVLLARLAVEKNQQGRGLRQSLLAEAILRTVSVSEEIGVSGMLVEAKDDAAAAFYQKYGFVPYSSNPLRLFQALPMLRKT
jgi:GNAT superfamily N-acetyltransferase